MKEVHFSVLITNKNVIGFAQHISKTFLYWIKKW